MALARPDMIGEMTPARLAVERCETLSEWNERCRVKRDLEPARQANYYARPSDFQTDDTYWYTGEGQVATCE
jgi:hypothetical protein